MVFRKVCRHLCRVALPSLLTALTSAPLLADEPAPAAATAPAVVASGTAAPAALFEPARVPAAGRAQSLLRVSKPGRYALAVKSETGTAIQLVDRLGGPGAPAGERGEKDGRLDVYLEPGEYLLRTLGAAGAKGEAQLSATPFKPLVEGELQLPELREIEAELGDLEERSYWFELAASEVFVFEAAGRHLADVSLWRDGSWRVDAPVKTSEIEPRLGRPLRLHQVAVQLAPGLYRLSLAGDGGLPWADDDGTHPVVLRRGLATVGEAGRGRHTLGLFGSLRFLVPRSATFMRLELPARGLPAGLSLKLDSVEYDGKDPFPESSGWLELTKESEPPYLEGYLAHEDDGYRVVTISGATGESFVFQHFNNERVRTFNHKGDYWLATLGAGDAADRLDATAVLTRRERGWASNEVPLKALASDVVLLGPGVVRRRKVSITGTSELFFSVAKLGEYEITMPKTALRVLPLAPTWQYSSASPPFGNLRGNVPFKEGGGRWKLDPGFYVLQLEPREQEVVELTLRALDSAAAAAITAPHGVAYLGSQALETRYDYTVFLNAEPGVEAGLVLRESPVDPRRPLPLEAGAKPVTVPIAIPVRGVLRAVAEDPAIQLALTVDGAAVTASTWIDAGRHEVTVARAGDGRPVAAVLRFEPADRVAEEPLPPLPVDALAKLPIYNQLDDKGDRFFDLEPGGTRTFLVHAAEPALYRLESTGLLDTEGSLRTSLRPRIEAAQDGGSGRNFLLQQFLRPGDYQLSVKAVGKSAGHLGVRLSRSPVRDGGVLPAGVSARADLPAGEAVAYRLAVPAAGKYRVRALGLGRPFRIRLDDAAGWPLPAPGSPGDLVLDLDPGEYRLIVLPQAVDGRVIARFDPLPAEVERQGHGPFVLPFATAVGNRWLEPAEGQERRPDVWSFSLPAPAGVSVSLDAEMQAELWRGGAKVADVPPARAFHDELPAGDYQLRAFCSRRNNQVDYHLRVDLDQLVAGQSRRLEAPGSVEISLAGEGLAEISSFGQVDVRARLYDPAGREVARFDDRPGDWNFAYTGRLAAGVYRLEVDPVSAGGPTEVRLRLPGEKLAAAEKLPLARKLKLAAGVEVIPLELPRDAEVLAFAAGAPGGVRLALEASEGAGSFHEVASREGAAPRLLVWLAPGPAYRLRVESLAHGESEVSLQGVALPLGAMSEKALASGVKAKAVAGLPADFGILAAAFERPGCFAVSGGAPALAAGLPGRAAAPVEKGQNVLGAPAGKLLLAADPRSAVKLSRWQLPEGESTFFLPAEGVAQCDLPAAKGEGLRLLRASALAGQPSLAPAAEAGTVQAVGAGSATTLLAGGGGVVLRGEGGAPLRLASRLFKAAAPTALAAAGGEGEVAAGGSVALRLPAGAKELRLLIDQGLVASLEGGGETRRVWSAEEGPVDVTLAGAFELLRLVDPASTAARWSLAISPAAEASGASRVAAGEPLERRLARAGQLELAVGGGREVHVRGARGTLLIGADGGIARGGAHGADLALPAGGGRLLVDGEPGLLWVWLDEGGGTLAGLWPAGQLAAGKTVALPAVEELGAGVSVYDFDLPGPTLLHLRGDGPGVVAAEPGEDAPLEVSAHAAAIEADLYLPLGRGRVAVRPAGGAAGLLLELRSSPVEKAGEGLGPSYLLGPGQSRYISFTVPVAGKVGWAARAESGVAVGRLLDAAGRELGRGGAGFRDLAAGEYLLGLSVPAAARPTRVRAALVGLVRRNDLPPQELIARYAAGTVPLPGELEAQAAAEREAAEEAAQAAAEAEAARVANGETGAEADAADNAGEENCEGEDCAAPCEGEDCAVDEGGGEESGGEEGGGEEGGGEAGGLF